MHAFHELADRSTRFILAVLQDEQAQAIEALQTSGATRHVKHLQMVELHRVVTAVGTFSIFEAMLQDQLSVVDGFQAARDTLCGEGFAELKMRFRQYVDAINVLKHGQGRSYERLLAEVAHLPFRLRLPHEACFEEGDVSEVVTLIKVDDAFVQGCVEVIREVATALKEVRADLGV